MKKFIAKQFKLPLKSKLGGKRPGSGRPRSGKFTRSVFVTDLEWKREVVPVMEKIKAARIAARKQVL